MKDKRKEKLKKIAEEQIRKLFREAENSSQELANSYVKTAWKLAAKTKTPIPRELKRRFCRKCLNYFKPGKNARIRVSRGKVIVYCLNCRNFRRFAYK